MSNGFSRYDMPLFTPVEGCIILRQLSPQESPITPSAEIFAGQVVALATQARVEKLAVGDVVLLDRAGVYKIVFSGQELWLGRITQVYTSITTRLP